MGKPNLRLRVASRRSQAAAMAAAPPVQMPGMAAMVGTVQASTFSNMRSMRASYATPSAGPGLKSRKSEMSVPAPKARPPAPVMMMARSVPSAGAVAQISPRRSYMLKVSALCACGRLKVTMPTGPFTSQMSSSLLVLSCIVLSRSVLRHPRAGGVYILS